MNAENSLIQESIKESIQASIQAIDSLVPNARRGLPQELFFCVSRLTPLINVDLLIVDELDRKLLTWREDAFFGPGWHIPGGIIRFKETASERIAAVATSELGAEVSHEARPCEVNELMAPHRDVRGHCISLLYRCKLVSQLDDARKAELERPHNGQWAWFRQCPEDLIKQHTIYRHCFD